MKNIQFNFIYLLIVILFIKFNNGNELEVFDRFSKHSQNHTNNWAVLVDTSRFWFNYRHVSNVLSIYRSVKV